MQCFSKCGLQRSSSSVTWGLIRGTRLGAPHRPTGSGTLERGPAVCALQAPPGDSDGKVWNPLPEVITNTPFYILTLKCCTLLVSTHVWWCVWKSIIVVKWWKLESTVSSLGYVISKNHVGRLFWKHDRASP